MISPQGSAQSFRDNGWQAKVTEFAPASIPLAGSYRFVVEAQNPAGGRVKTYAYVAARGRMFSLQHVSADEKEPEIFREFVGSFRFVGKGRADPLQAVSQIHFFVATMVMLLIGGVGASINAIAKRIIVNLWYTAIAALLLGGVALSVYWAPRLHGATPFRSGEIWGQVIGGPILMPLGFAVSRAVTLERRRRKESAHL